MKEQLISFETAKLAKKKKFDESTVNHYDIDGVVFMDDLKNSEHLIAEYSAPTQRLLQDWIFENHGFYIEDFMDDDGSFGYMISKFTE